MFVPLSYSFESFWKIVQWNASLLATAKPRAHMKTRWGGSNSEDVVQAHINNMETLINQEKILPQ